MRGAYSMISSLPPERLAPVWQPYSSGNHAQAVALAASLLGAPATILMPDDAPAAKRRPRAATARRWSGTTAMPMIVRRGAALAAERGLTLIPPYDIPS